MAVPDAAVSFLLENLSQILKYNYHLIKDVEVNIQELKRDLETLEGLLTDYTTYNHDGQYLKNEVKTIRGIIDRAEDVVETYLLHSALQKARNWPSKTFHSMTDYPKVLRDVGKEIEQISNEVKQLKLGREGGLLALQHQAIVNLDRRPRAKEAPKVEEEHVVGFDEAAETVSKLLTEGPEQFEAISIVGMLGLGKTTLARKVLKDPKVDYEYGLRVFVYISKEYEKRDVLLKILSSLPKTNDDVNKMTDEELGDHLHKQLTDRQYLIVLDDIWEKQDWDTLKGAFPNNNNKRCRVLITTRNEEVAKHANKKDSSWYKLDFLPVEESRELLRWKVFGGEDFPPEFKKYEIQIAQKCDGLPLAIVVISGLICNDPYNGEWWKHVADSVKDYIARDQEPTMVLDLMYKHLPNHLKLCFLYLGVFREDFEIPVWKLVRLWIAEGLITWKEEVNLEIIAERNLEELVYRNVVMVGQRRSNDKIKTCQLHDTLREFCKKQAAEENLFQEIKKEKLFSFLSPGDLTLGRRICINNVNVLDMSPTPPQIPSGKCVRSFLTFCSEEKTIDVKCASVIPKTFKLLRVLEVQSLNFAGFPGDICYLGLLKYIAITSSFSLLPKAMSILVNLQTIIVNTSSPSLDIQTNIWNMPQFRHLHTNTSTMLPSLDPKNKITKDDSLIQTLSTITPESCRKEIFAQTPKLKKLGIRGTLAKLFEVRGDFCLLGSIRNLNSLKNLKLLNDDVNSPLSGLPLVKNVPKDLTKLTLENTLLSWEEMSTLGKLENLEVLKLKDNAFKGTLWETEKGGFRLLKHLHIGRTDLGVWEASVDHFPKLKRLKLYNCDRLAAIPHGLAEISSLELIVLHRTNHKVASSARKLELLKVKEAQKRNIKSNFKLSIYPPDH